jgi:hypothetical protein
MKTKIGLIAVASVLAGCSHLETITPEEAARGAEAARAWLDVFREAKEIVVTPEK